MEVQEITFNYFARPQPRDLNFYVRMMMAIQKILLSMVSKCVVGVWDGLDACEISRPEILSQSAPVSNPIYILSYKPVVRKQKACLCYLSACEQMLDQDIPASLALGGVWGQRRA